MTPTDQQRYEQGTCERTSEQCLSDRVLDELVAEPGEGPAQTAAREHLHTCQRCADRLALFSQSAELAAPLVAQTLAAAHARQHERPAPGWLASFFAAPRLPARLAFAGAAAALVLVVAGLVGRYTFPVGQDETAVRVKGEASMRFFVQRAGVVRPGTSGDVFQSGDALRFVVRAPRDGYFMLVGLDGGTGTVTMYYPSAGTQSVALAAGAEVPLPNSLVLDESSDSEYFLGLFTPEPASLTEVSRALTQAWQQNGQSPAGLRAAVLPGHAEWIIVRKR
jgi:hypothetical protein